MVVETMLFVVAVLLAGMLGFAAHRASICTVKAVAEIFTTGRVHMLACFAKTALWVVLVTLVLTWLVPPDIMMASAWAASGASILGGFLFGIGSAVNGGCAFSTLGRLMDGYLGMAATLVGVVAGAVISGGLTSRGLLPAPVRADVGAGLDGLAAAVLVGMLVVLGMADLWRLRRPVEAGAGIVQRVLAPRYRLSTTAALIGISNGLLFALYGSWVFTSAMMRTFEKGLSAAMEPAILVLWVLFAAVLTGMYLSARQRRSFQVEWPPMRRWAAHLAGGVLMGAGAAIVPGGNDALILSAVPALSPHALPAYAAVLAGIAATFVATLLAGGRIPVVHCRADMCIEE